MNGDWARRASRRAISVLPTPVGPIIRMFFGVTSSAMSAGSCWRRIRFRNAMATARLAFAWPMTYLSSSATISRGVSERAAVAVRSGKKIAISQFFDREVGIRINTDVGRDRHGFGRDVTRIELAMLRERPRGRHRERPTRSDRHDPIVGLDQIASAGQQECRALVGDNQHGLEAPEQPIGPPVARELDGRSFEVAAILFKLRFKAREERERIRSRTGKTRKNRIVIQPADFLRALLEDGAAEGHLPVPSHDRAVMMPD